MTNFKTHLEKFMESFLWYLDWYKNVYLFYIYNSSMSCEVKCTTEDYNVM